MPTYYGLPQNRTREVITGSETDDVFYPLGGWDIVQGKGGIDTVYVEGLSANFRLRTEEGVTYVDALSGASAGVESAQLYDIERVVFTDRAVDLTAPQSFVARDGNDNFVGNAGLDTVTYLAPRNQFRVERVGDYHFITDRVGAGGVDRLQKIERITFSDGKLALDLTGDARDTARLIGNLLGPQSVQGSADAERLVGLVLNLFDQGQSLLQVSEFAVKALGWNTETVIRQVFINALGREVTPSELGALLNDFASVSTAQVAELACNLGLIDARIGLTGLADTGLPYLSV